MQKEAGIEQGAGSRSFKKEGIDRAAHRANDQGGMGRHSAQTWPHHQARGDAARTKGTKACDLDVAQEALASVRSRSGRFDGAARQDGDQEVGRRDQGGEDEGRREGKREAQGSVERVERVDHKRRPSEPMR